LGQTTVAQRVLEYSFSFLIEAWHNNFHRFTGWAWQNKKICPVFAFFSIVVGTIAFHGSSPLHI
jgi:hypothetical protein